MPPASRLTPLFVIGRLCWGILFLAGTSSAQNSTSSAGDLELKTQTIRHAQAIAAAEPFTESWIRVKGVVTWVDRTAGKTFYIQDQTGGIQVSCKADVWPNLGDEIDTQGVLTRGSFTPLITLATFESHGPQPLPGPKAASGGGLLTGTFNGERVKVEGWVRAGKMIGPHRLALVLDSGGARLPVQISNFNLDTPPDRLISGKLYAIGIATPVKARGAFSQLVEIQVLVASGQDASFSIPQYKSPWDLPLLSLHAVFQYTPGQARNDRKHTRGEIIYKEGDVLYLNDGEGGLTVKTTGASDLHPGEWVEVAGFLDMESFLPILTDAVVIPATKPGAPVKPTEFTSATLMNGLQHANYVTVTGRLLDQLQAPLQADSDTEQSSLVLSLKAPQGIFTAELKKTEKLPASLEPGCMLKVSGICIVQTDAVGTPTAFKILVPDSADIVVTRHASYFTVKRLLISLSIVLGVLLVVSLLAFVYARRNTRLEGEMRERRVISAERNRLARDLHDTLEQGLTGIQLRLHGIQPGAEDSGASLAAARSLVQQCHIEMRQAIWNLRAETLEHFDLGEALERTARSLVLGSSIKVELKQKGPKVRIPPLIVDNLFRIGQEALTNAVKHATPTLLTIEQITTSSHISLVITDNGHGMDAPETKTGHFGLVGMKERAERIGGQLIISSMENQGATIRIDIPLPAKA